jgi:chemotaxis protein CheD
MTGCINVQPGELHIARRPTVMKTILGSCIGVTFWSPRTGAAALCHCVLPCCPPDASTAERSRYVDGAIRYVAQCFDRWGISRRELQIRIFGGADVLPSSPRARRPTIGTMNRDRAVQVLAEEGFSILARDVGGTRGRTIQFNGATGEVWSRLLARLAEQ